MVPMFKILDLFCGCGGMSVGFDSLPHFETKIGVDFNAHAIKTFAYNFSDSTAIHGDITDSDTKDKIITIARQENINMIIGGPPCQGFSLKGKRGGLQDPRNFLFLEYLDIVKKISPAVFVIENVKELLSTTDGFFMQEIKNICDDIGYKLTYGVLDAVDFGVPQHRKRAIIIGCKTTEINLPIAKNIGVRTVKDAIYDLRFLNSGEGTFEQDYRFDRDSEYQSILRNGGKLFNHIATNHSEVALQKLRLIAPEKGKECLPKNMWGKQQFSTTWGRLEWAKPSPTIDTRFDTPSNGKNSHPELHRSITVREAARIQSFKDSFVFLGTKTEMCKQVGNAVPPLLAQAIGESIVTRFKA